MARKLKNGKVNYRVLEIIGKNYDKLKSLCNYNDRGNYCSKSYEDIFQDTIIYVAHDKDTFTMSTEEEIIEHFVFRHKMMEFQTINDDKMLKEIEYADHLQTQAETTKEEW